MEMQLTAPVRTECGLICGEEKDGVRVFRGIPYAAAPVGELRFKATQKHAPWDGVLECTAFGSSPMQAPLSDMFDNLWTKEFIVTNKHWSEDCLTMNIWAPEAGEKCPVVLYLFGGGFCSGGSSCEIYDGTSFVRQGIIYITFNHREGNLSLFTCPELDRESPTGNSGNCNLMDTIFALKWIRENIAAFGGDPDNITLWGQSSGAAEAQALGASEAAKGLVRRVIAMGYNCYTRGARPWFDRKQGQEASAAVLRESGKTWEEYRAQPGEKFAEGTVLQNLLVDGDIVRKKYADSVNDGDTSHTDMLLGAVAGDSLMGNMFRPTLACKPPENMDEVKAAMKTYFGGDYEKALAMYRVDEQNDYMAVIREVNDDNLVMNQLAMQAAREKTGTGSRTVTYYFVHPMPGPYAHMFGAFHSAEVPYFTGFLSERRKDWWQEEDRALAAYLNRQLAGFIRCGVCPDPVWDCSQERSYVYIDEAGKTERRVFPADRYALWMNAFESQSRQA